MKFKKIPSTADDNGHVTSVNGDIRMEPDPDTQCGIGSFRPPFLQVSKKNKKKNTHQTPSRGYFP